MSFPTPSARRSRRIRPRSRFPGRKQRHLPAAPLAARAEPSTAPPRPGPKRCSAGPSARRSRRAGMRRGRCPSPRPSPPRPARLPPASTSTQRTEPPGPSSRTAGPGSARSHRSRSRDRRPGRGTPRPAARANGMAARPPSRRTDPLPAPSTPPVRTRRRGSAPSRCRSGRASPPASRAAPPPRGNRPAMSAPRPAAGSSARARGCPPAHRRTRRRRRSSPSGSAKAARSGVRPPPASTRRRRGRDRPRCRRAGTRWNRRRLTPLRRPAPAPDSPPAQRDRSRLQPRRGAPPPQSRSSSGFVVLR